MICKRIETRSKPMWFEIQASTSKRFNFSDWPLRIPQPMVDRMTLQPPVSSLLVACPLEPFWQLTMGSCMSCWSWCAKDRKDELFPHRLWVARDGVSYHISNDCPHILRNPADEVWTRTRHRCPLCFPALQDQQ